MTDPELSITQLWCTSPGQQRYGIHQIIPGTLGGSLTSEGEIRYDLASDKATVHLWGQFPGKTFTIPDFQNFLVCEDGYEDLKKLILIYVKKTEKEIHALRGAFYAAAKEAAEADASEEAMADAAQDARACELEEEREWMEENANYGGSQE